MDELNSSNFKYILDTQNKRSVTKQNFIYSLLLKKSLFKPTTTTKKNTHNKKYIENLY